MSYEPSLDLQDMIYRRLVDQLTVPVFDHASVGQPTPYVSFGPESVVEDDAECILGTAHSFQVDVWSTQKGKAEVKTIMGQVKRALHHFDGQLTDNALHSIEFDSSTIVMEPDGKTYHGVVQFTALIEE